MEAEAAQGSRRGSGAVEVLLVSLRLGLTSFGGPVAHLGYFERSYVRQRRWLDPQEYAGVVALCQLLPGPASSQTGFLIGLRRAGWRGALAAWIGFTLPSALLMYGFALAAPLLRGAAAQPLLHGLKLAAVAVVAQAVWQMARRLCPDVRRAAIAVAAAALLLAVGAATAQLAALALGALAGLLLCRRMTAPATVAVPPIGAAAVALLLAVFAGLFLGLPWLAQRSPHSGLALAAVFYRSGALVFGGGHVLLPLLRDALVPGGWIGDDRFLAGYGAAQALPGPLFAFAAYLGAASAPAGAGAAWACIATVAIFAPGLLLAAAGTWLWQRIAAHAAAMAALAGVNAAVVGVLGAALYRPVLTSAVLGWPDAAIAVAGLLALEKWRAPPLLVVLSCVAASFGLALAGA